MEKVLEDKEFYYSMYNKKLVDKAFDYFKESGFFNEGRMGAMLALEEKICKDMTPEERGAHFLKMNLTTYMFAYLHGAIENIGLTEEETRPERENIYSEYRKNKDFCVFYFFGDNDFGEHVKKGAEMIVNNYNDKLFYIDQYKDCSDWKIENSLYVKDINEIEKLETIQKALAYGVISSDIESTSEYALTMPHKYAILDHKIVVENAYDKIDYLHINDNNYYKVGTYKEVEEWVFNHEKWHWKEGKTLKETWFNGEALIIAMEDGEMKYWIK